MTFIMGFAVWTAIGLAAGFALRVLYRVPRTDLWLSLVFGFFGAFIGGMLGSSGYVHHDPNPLRVGALIGALSGSFLFAWIYHFTSDKAV